MASEVHDVVVIGGGLIGMSTAYFLAKAGRDVCVLEKGILGGEASGRCGGGVGQSHREPGELPIAARAIELWKALLEESDLDFEYRQHGNLRLAWNEQDVADLQAMVEREQAEGLDCRWLDRAETRSLAPYIADGTYLGSVYTPSSGSAEPYLSCVAMARAASRAGAILHEHREATRIDTAKGEVTGVQTSTGPIATRVVVNAANAWAATISVRSPYRIPVEVKRGRILMTEQLPPFMGPFISTNKYGYHRQTLSGNVLLGFPSQPLESLDRTFTYQDMVEGARTVATVFPGLRNVSVIRAFTGFTAWSPDFRPIVGALEEPQGLIVAAVFCGLGFAIGPAIGELVAQLVLDGQTSLPIAQFSPYRFSRPGASETASGSQKEM
jgi:sarcosine oxidase subunit beta